MNHNNLTPSRRTFLKSAGLVSGMLLLPHGHVRAVESTAERSSDALFTHFQNPSVLAKPFVRWWWNGDKVDAAELCRELDVMKANGIGGVEINPIAFSEKDDLGIPTLTWLSDEWIQMVKATLRHAEKIGIVCDIIAGTGWPFGAEFLEGSERSQLLTRTCRKVSGPATLQISNADFIKEAEPQNYSRLKDKSSEVHSLWLTPEKVDTFAPPVPIPFDKTKDTQTIEVPAGDHVLCALVKFTGFQAVIHGAPGGGGPVLNHYDTAAVEKFLNQMSEKLFPKLKGIKGFRSIFCDSMELDGANWCDDFVEEFKRRRHYDILPYLPFFVTNVGNMGDVITDKNAAVLTGDAQEEVGRARYDFIITCMEIIRDRFLLPFTAWCNKHGYQSRGQIYGNEFHPLDASFDIDIPECETWTFGYTTINKFVASAAHLAGKKVVSCEEVTNTSRVFGVTLEQVKIVGDQSTLSGVTHPVLCGYNYSPQQAPFPGWVRYGTFFDEKNTWWQFFKEWAAYKARLSSLLLETEPFADIAVLHPLADLWMKHGPQREPFPKIHYPKYQYRIWEGIHHSGSGCDYTSESVIQKSTVENGELCFGTRRYRTVILLEVETISPETLAKLAEFVAGGGKLIFTAKEPHKAPGLTNWRENDKKIAETTAALKRDYPKNVFTVEACGDNAITWFENVCHQCGISPYLHIDKPNGNVSQIRQQTADQDIYFFSNNSEDKRFVLNVTFTESQGTPWLWEPLTGKRFRYPVKAGKTLELDLPPSVSRLIVFEKSRAVTPSLDDADNPFHLPAPESPGVELGGWTLRSEHIDGTVQTRKIDAFFDLSTNKETQAFAGYLYYETALPDTFSGNWLDLGKVHGASEVFVDGVKLGGCWHGRHLYPLPENAGGKLLSIKITTTMSNYFKTVPQNKTGYRWTRNQQVVRTGLLGPVKVLSAKKEG
jgi:hypothetical protein